MRRIFDYPPVWMALFVRVMDRRFIAREEAWLRARDAAAFQEPRGPGAGSEGGAARGGPDPGCAGSRPPLRARPPHCIAIPPGGGLTPGERCERGPP